LVQKQSPPREELDFRLRESLPLFQGSKALPADIITKWLNDHVFEKDAGALRVIMNSPFGDDVVFLEDEYADPQTRLGLLVGGTDPLTNEFQSLKINSEGRLMVDAAISFSSAELEIEVDVLDGDQIGVWGYDNGDTNFPVPLNLTSEGYLQTSIVGNENMSIVYDEGTFSGNIEHSVVLFTVPVGKEFNLTKITGEGICDALFRVKVNGTTIERKRNNWCDRNMNFTYARGLLLNAGDTVELTIAHSQLTSKTFSGTIYGENQ
jgi:hypothetical protein